MKNFLQKYIREFIFAIMILLLMGKALFSSGGILLLDYVATLHWNVNFLQHGWFLMPQIPVSILGFEWGTKLTFLAILISSYYLGILLTR